MSREPARNLAASVRARLLTLAQEKGEDYQRIQLVLVQPRNSLKCNPIDFDGHNGIHSRGCTSFE